MIEITWDEIEAGVDDLVEAVEGDEYESVYGIPNGGTPVAQMMASRLGLPLAEHADIDANTLIVDDLVDTGRTMARLLETTGAEHGAALYRKPHSPDMAGAVVVAEELDGWVEFPWERTGTAGPGPEDNVVRLLEYLGEDPTRSGLVDTPGRVIKALSEMTAGYEQDPADILGTRFDADYDEMVVVSGIPFHSLCEHHMLPFSGHVTVGYIPKDQVVGLSKIPRVVHAFARRLQIQEGMTADIAKAIATNLDPVGTAVIVTAHHSCMSLRGVGSPGQMTTSAMLGAFRDKPEARAELLALHRERPA